MNNKIVSFEEVKNHPAWINNGYSLEEKNIIFDAIFNKLTDSYFEFEIDDGDLIISKTNNHGAIYLQIKNDGKIEFSYALRTKDGGMVRLDGDFVKGKRASNLNYLEMIFHLDVTKKIFEARKFGNSYILNLDQKNLTPYKKSDYGVHIFSSTRKFSTGNFSQEPSSLAKGEAFRIERKNPVFLPGGYSLPDD